MPPKPLGKKRLPFTLTTNGMLALTSWGEHAMLSSAVDHRHMLKSAPLLLLPVPENEVSDDVRRTPAGWLDGVFVCRNIENVNAEIGTSDG